MEKVKNVDVKKMSINMKNKDKITQIKEFYNEKIKKWHIITFLVVAILYTIVFISRMYALKTGSEVIEAGYPLSLGTQVKENFLLNSIMLVVGITPYVPFSILGVSQAFLIIDDMLLRSMYGISFIPFLYIGGLIQILGISLTAVAGVYFCRLTTKRNKYQNSSDFGMDDFKMQIYQIKKDDAKIQELINKKEEKKKKIEKYNVKIPYFNFISLGMISFVLGVIGIIITKI